MTSKCRVSRFLLKTIYNLNLDYMGKGIIALILEALLFLFFYTHWNPLFEEQREQERSLSVLNSVTTDMCKHCLDLYLVFTE